MGKDYEYALEVDDSLLLNLSKTLQNSILVNSLCTVLVFVLSAAAGFFVGFLMIRSRKHEIAILRAMGTPAVSIYLGFAAEQMACVVAGIVLGGVWYLFRPLERLLGFAGLYFAGLTVALIVFLRKNLLTTIKEEE